jgi:hypothetical protein
MPMKTRVAARRGFGASALLCLAWMLNGCGGGGGATAVGGGGAPSGRAELLGYAVEDALLGAQVRLYALGATTPAYETSTGATGRFVIPSTLANGDYRLEVTGGSEDADGQAATTADQRPFAGTLTALVALRADSQAALLVGAASTGLARYAAGDMSRYAQAFTALAGEVPAMVILDAADPAAAVRLAAVSHRALGWDTIIDELGDDGQFNASRTPLSGAVVSNVLAAAAAPGALSGLADLNLRVCVAEAVDKDAADVTAADLRSLTQLECNDRGIGSTAGLSSVLPLLEYLHLEDNAIADVAGVAGLARLKLLNIRNNRVATLQPLLGARPVALGLMVAENCIAAATELNDTADVNFSGYDLRARRQYSDCVKNTVELLGWVVRQRTDGQHVLTYRSTYNPQAVCGIDWGDGSTQTAQCDGRTYFPTHRYASGVAATLRFLANGVVVREAAVEAASQAMQVLDFQPRTLQAGREQVLRITGANLPVGTPLDVQVPPCQFGQTQYLTMTSTLHELSCRVGSPQSAQVVVRAQSGGQLLSWQFPVTSALVFGVVSASYYGPTGWVEGALADFDPRVSTSGAFNHLVEMNFGNTSLDLDGMQIRFDTLPGCSTLWLKFLIDDRARYPDAAAIPRENMALAFVGRDVLPVYPSVSGLPQWPMGAGSYLITFTRQSAYVMNWQVSFPDASTLLSSGTINTSGMLSRTDGYSNLVMFSQTCGVANMTITHPTLGRVF